MGVETTAIICGYINEHPSKQKHFFADAVFELHKQYELETKFPKWKFADWQTVSAVSGDGFSNKDNGYGQIYWTWVSDFRKALKKQLDETENNPEEKPFYDYWLKSTLLFIEERYKESLKLPKKIKGTNYISYQPVVVIWNS